MAKPYLSVVIPAYNEENSVSLTLLDVDRHLRARGFPYEILFISDGSKDRTAEVAEGMRRTVKNLKVVSNGENHGKGAAVRQGMLLAQGKIRLFMDADNATSVDQFDKMIPYFNEGYEVVIGSRAHRESRSDPPQPLYRQIPGKLGNLFIQLLLLPGMWDTQCGFKAFTAEAAERIFSVMRIDRFGFDAEALALAKRLGYRIREVPVVWVNNPNSHVSASAYLQVLLETIKIRLWLWTGGYSP